MAQNIKGIKKGVVLIVDLCTLANSENENENINTAIIGRNGVRLWRGIVQKII